MHGLKHDLSSTQINLPEHLATKIIAWGRKIPNEDIFKDPDRPSFGREDEIHITVLYGLHSASPAETRYALSGTKSFTVELGTVSLFSDAEKPFDVVKISVKCPELHKLNKKIRSEVEYTNKYDDYQPHVTVAYVKKGRGWKYSGDKTFDGKLFEADHVLFSPKNGSKTRIALS